MWRTVWPKTRSYSQQQYAFGFQSLVAGDWYLACAPSSEDAQGSGTCLPGSGTCLPGSGTFGTLSPSLCFFLWSIRVSGLHQGSGILGLLFPFIVFLLVRDLFPGFRDFWNFVSRHCFCFVVHQGAGLHQGSGILRLLSPIIVFFLVVYQGSGFLEPCLPSLCLFCGPSGRGTSSGFRDSWTFVFPSLCFFLWFMRAPGFLEPCLPSLCLFCGPSGRGTSSGFRDSWTFVSHHCVSSGSGTCLPSSRTCLPGSGTCGTLSPIIVFFLVVYEGSGILGNSQQQSLLGFNL